MKSPALKTHNLTLRVRPLTPRHAGGVCLLTYGWLITPPCLNLLLFCFIYMCYGLLFRAITAGLGKKMIYAHRRGRVTGLPAAS